MEEIGKLRETRKKRLKGIKRDVVLGAGGVAGASFAFSLAANPSFRQGAALIASMTALMAAGGPIISSVLHAPEIQRATKLVGSALSEEAKSNEAFRRWLGKNRYTIVTGKGELAGTNRARFLGIGRIRLENHKILAGAYE